MKLVEIILGEKTCYETVEVVKEVAETMGKICVIARKDRPGFIVNRILIPYLNEAARIVYEGNARMEEIDSAMHFKANFPIGPFMLMDLIGLDILYGIMKVFEEKLDHHYGPIPSIVKLFKSRKLGRKSGAGFYDYNDRMSIIKGEVESDFDIKRLLSIIINEAARVVEEKVADIKDVDIAIKYGLNLPEGPFEILHRLGKDTILETLCTLEKKSGRAYSPSPILSNL
jgi:enoyl-CoA hydratase/3-hydroxyacyl-CoA dehydrogenase